MDRGPLAAIGKEHLVFGGQIAREDGQMFARLRRFLGYVLYLIGWGLAVLVLAQAIILSLATGSPLIPVVLGFVGIAIWAIGIFFRRIFAQR